MVEGCGRYSAGKVSGDPFALQPGINGHQTAWGETNASRELRKAVFIEALVSERRPHSSVSRCTRDVDFGASADDCFEGMTCRHSREPC